MNGRKMAEEKAYRSHLEMVVKNPYVNFLLEDIVNQLNGNGWDFSRLSLDPEDISAGTKAYYDELTNGQTEHHKLTMRLASPFWKNQDIKTEMHIKGECTNKNHRGIIRQTVELSWEQILEQSDEELTVSLLSPACPKCHTPSVVPLESFIQYEPRKQKARDILNYQTRRSKAAGNLSEKLADKILGVEEITRPNRILGNDERYLDLYGTRFLANSVDGCYSILDSIESGGVEVLQKKDYFRNPKDNGYRGIHLYVGVAGGYLYELQIRDLMSHFVAETDRDAGHQAYSESIRQARLQLGEKWNNLYSVIASLLGVPDEKRII